METITDEKIFVLCITYLLLPIFSIFFFISIVEEIFSIIFLGNSCVVQMNWKFGFNSTILTNFYFFFANAKSSRTRYPYIKTCERNENTFFTKTFEPE